MVRFTKEFKAGIRTEKAEDGEFDSFGGKLESFLKETFGTCSFYYLEDSTEEEELMEKLEESWKSWRASTEFRYRTKYEALAELKWSPARGYAYVRYENEVGAVSFALIELNVASL